MKKFLYILNALNKNKYIIYYKYKGGEIMGNIYSQMDINSYVAKYMDENGCSLEEACEELGIDPYQVFTSSKDEEK